MSHKAGWILGAFSLLALSSPAQAQMGPPNPDLNRDGNVTLTEYKSSQTDSLFTRLDADKDRKITRQEFKSLEDLAKRFGGAKGAAFAGKVWSQSDINRDGTILVSEVESASTKRFQRGDANRDGVLTKDELKAMRAAAQTSTD